MKTWRSLLFAPADNAALLAKSHLRGADAIIIDLEDAVAPAAKPAARLGLAAAAKALRANGADIVVRINSGWRDAFADLDAAVLDSVCAIMAPKIEIAAQVETISAITAEFEEERGLPLGGIGVLALIESPSALTQLCAIAKIQRVWGLALGTEDFSLALGTTPNRAALDLPVRQIALAAAQRSLMALAAPVSIAAFRDIEAYRTACQDARAVGANGAICVHPNQVSIANEVFGISDAEREDARRILDAWAQAQLRGSSVTSLDGRMIDAPVVARARRLAASR